MEAFGKPKKPESTRYKMPNIEDLIEDLKDSSNRIKSRAITLKSSQNRKLQNTDLDKILDI